MAAKTALPLQKHSASRITWVNVLKEAGHIPGEIPSFPFDSQAFGREFEQGYWLQFVFIIEQILSHIDIAINTQFMQSTENRFPIAGQRSMECGSGVFGKTTYDAGLYPVQYYFLRRARVF